MSLTGRQDHVYSGGYVLMGRAVDQPAGHQQGDRDARVLRAGLGVGGGSAEQLRVELVRPGDVMAMELQQLRPEEEETMEERES